MKTVFICTALCLLGSDCAQQEAAEPEVVVQVKLESAHSEDLEVTETAPASIFPRSEAKVASPLTATIQRLNVRKGDQVRKGQILAELARGDLEAQHAEAMAQMADAQANLEKVTSGTLPTDTERARGELEKATAALAEAEKIFERREKLFQEGAIPERELLVSKTRYEQAKTDQQVAQKTLEFLTSRSMEQDVRMAESRLEEAKARLDYVRAQLEYALIRSPSDGVVTEQFLYPGDMAKSDSPVFTVVDLSVAVARGQFPESRAAALRKGQECWFQTSNFPEDRFKGSTTVVSQTVSPVSRTIEVWCEIPNRKDPLKAGAFGELTVVTGMRRDAITVPQAAVQFEEGTQRGVVWTVDEEGLAHSREVTTGVVSQGRVEILSGLKSGQSVVIEGGYGLAEDIKVHAVEAGSSEALDDK